MKVYLNGKFVDQSKATVSVFDHGLLYGDGVFEGIRSYRGRIFKLYEQGLALITVATQRNVPEALNPQIKSLNYLNNILGKIEAINAGYEEAIMLSHSGYVTECTGENVFLVKGKRLLTPPPYIGVLRGITRQTVMELGRQQRLQVEEDLLTRHDLFNADEVFLTGTAAEIVPVVNIDGRRIGSGRPGAVTKQLQAAFRQVTKTEGVALSKSYRLA